MSAGEGEYEGTARPHTQWGPAGLLCPQGRRTACICMCMKGEIQEGTTHPQQHRTRPYSNVFLYKLMRWQVSEQNDPGSEYMRSRCAAVAGVRLGPVAELDQADFSLAGDEV